MAHDSFLTGIDLGSTAVRIVVGQPTETGKVNLIGVAEVPSEGISKGAITSIEDAVTAISTALERVERMTGQPVERATVGMNGTHIASQESHGVVAVSRADNEIHDDDVERVIEAAQAVATPPNHEILHIIPRTFTVDEQRGIKDPIGMTGYRLEVDAQIIQALSSQVKNLTKCVFRTSVDIDDLVLGVLAGSEAVLTKRQKELGVALVDLGGATTSLIVFEEGDVVHTKVLPVGAGHITNDIAIGLRTSIDIAERLKVEFGTALPNDVGKKEDIGLDEVGGSSSEAVSRRQIAEIIEARLEEILSLIDKELQSIDRSGMLPAGVVLTGGGAKLPGVVEVAKKEFRLPASIGYPLDIMTAIDKLNDPSFATAIGLAYWGALGGTKGAGGSFLSRFSSVSEVTGKIQKWFKSLIP
ncbi:MAG: cell division protein FtsA [Candidatus Kerfeldbacteria bacterium]|nr:cell division protein FtsA [Candidatus Kerfeldbacteria bacterium]